MDRTRGIHMVYQWSFTRSRGIHHAWWSFTRHGTAFTWKVELYVQGWHSRQVRSFTPPPTHVISLVFVKGGRVGMEPRSEGAWSK